ncbi:16S rRNA (uracil(1498)-N(3))-methyltransferase [Salinibacterium sp. dk2585]|uniref:16S rRNA (uracil(1498)-N(3))-methyltransferase n=1 Tax=unclassified Salinibacterium TaxID=2632331 RepID=UPI0011C25760|nr:MULTISPECIES: 16S rRNA (uracil(1498)-N(3))-methyltransferase [unclassified Salinibacterium]QEE61401.1 16S rRNA (uracil(1498)-N(3))-methyltransferase [Salinibacterium sp. dk2585]TXK54078.1 16S rRNA (uracil(1498)-N(3))-methyltransferase [Salinibacterium sp. dk5596]
MAHFYLADGLSDTAPGSLVTIEGAEAKHAVSVSRVRVGEVLSIGNGEGLVATGTVEEAAPTRLSIRADEVVRHPPPSARITLVQALAKGGRDESAVQASTELGVDAVVPWAASRSVVKWDANKRDKGRERWRAIVREATKQSMRPYLPQVHEPVTTKEIARLAESALVLVLEPTAQTPLTSVEASGRDIVLVVGPEGGIAPEELDMLAAAGCVPVRLGSSVLRTSTAGPAALAVLSALTERW